MFLLMIIVVEAVMILSSLFRNKDEERKGPFRRNAEQPGPRPRPAALNRGNRPDFLEEFNRRRLEAARQQASRSGTSPSPPRAAKPATEPPRRTVTSREGAATEAGQRTIPPVLGETAVEQVLTQGLSQVERMARKIATAVPAPAKPSEAPSAAAARELAKPPVTALAPSSRRRAAQQTRAIVSQLLRSGSALPTAVILNEILGPPLSRQRQRRKKIA
jgi:hypothetical protein